MKTLSLQAGVDVQGVFDGSLALLPAIAESQALMNHAKDIAEDNLQFPSSNRWHGHHRDHLTERLRTDHYSM